MVFAALVVGVSDLGRRRDLGVVGRTPVHGLLSTTRSSSHRDGNVEADTVLP
jgi:hypothetical protein